MKLVMTIAAGVLLALVLWNLPRWWGQVDETMVEDRQDAFFRKLTPADVHRLCKVESDGPISPDAKDVRVLFLDQLENPEHSFVSFVERPDGTWGTTTRHGDAPFCLAMASLK